MQKFTLLSLLLVSFGACMHAATLTHRYAFTNDANDSIGSLNGTLTGNNAQQKMEAPRFSNDIPDNANTSVAKKSIQFGMTLGTKASAVNFGKAQIFDGVAGSFSYWFKADQLSGTRELLSNIASSGLRIRLLGNGKLRLTVAGMGDVDFTFDSGVSALKWHHLVVAWDDPNGTLKIALDGSIRTQAFTADALENPVRFIVGNFSAKADNQNTLNTQFDGKLFDLQMYQGMLSDTDIRSLFENPGSVLSELSIPEPRAL